MVKVKYFFFLISFFALFFVTASVAEANIVTVRKNGEVVLNVLSNQDELSLNIPKRSSLEVKDISIDSTVPKDSKVSLDKDESGVYLTIADASGQKTLNVSDFKDDLILVEERPEVQSFRIGVLGSKFVIEQEGILAETEFKINIDPATAQISVETDSGIKFVSVLPKDAINSLVKAKFISILKNEGKISLVEGEKEELTYVILGEKVIELLNLLKIKADVEGIVSASTGEIISIEQPIWLKLFGFMFS